MKKVGAVILVLFLTMALFAGCGKQEEAKNPDPTPIVDVPGIDEPTDDLDEHEIYPAPVMQWIEQTKDVFMAHYIEYGDQTFFVITWGEKTSGGYVIEIVDIKETDEEITIEVSFREPDGLAATVMTYPYTVEVMDGKVDDRLVNFVDVDNQQFIYRVYGLYGSHPFLKESSTNLRIVEWITDPTLVQVSGIARAFEANINWVFADIDGNELGSIGYVTAAAGNGDWGYFQLTLDEIPEKAEYLVLFLPNMEDGSRFEEVWLQFHLK